MGTGGGEDEPTDWRAGVLARDCRALARRKGWGWEREKGWPSTVGEPTGRAKARGIELRGVDVGRLKGAGDDSADGKDSDDTRHVELAQRQEDAGREERDGERRDAAPAQQDHRHQQAWKLGERRDQN